ncbi:MAG TPA: ATP-binding cassette domain-containing protein [Vicinamibacterales bacterium]|nr:ATP-binding cassette domain-containing protein [Vicinamibacterales bacterium]
MIQLAQLHKTFGDRVLFDHVTWQIGDRDRVGLCGPNGAGKTTLLRMLAGIDEPDSGQVVTPSGLTVGYLPQDGLNHRGRTLIDEASMAFAELLGQKAEMHALEARLGDDSVPEGEHESMLVRYAELQERFRRDDGYSIDLRIATVLRGLGFSQEDLAKPTETFSGGWQMRIALAKLLLGRPGLLLLDEPTNHLDLEARNWLEEYLSTYPHAVILVSHDRYFLDAVVTRITDLNLRTLTDYVGNYSKYVEQRDAMLERLRQAKRDQDEEVARVKMFIDRFRYQATKASQVQSRIKMLEKVVPIEVPPERKRIHFDFPTCGKSGRTVLELKNARKAYGDHVVFRGVNLHIERGDRIALVGPNGTGKSTLMRMLSGEEAPDAGERIEGHNLVMQYFAQDEATRLDPAPTVYETLASGSPLQMVPAIRNILGGFLFSGEDVYKPVRVLSGGERTRLAVARMLLRPSNTLLLDEPTNHLDLDSKEVLLDALVDYGGTLVFVSHDRYFVERLGTRIIEIAHGEALVYPGTYKEFLWHKEQPSGPGAGSRDTQERQPGQARQGRQAAGPAKTPGRQTESTARGGRPADATNKSRSASESHAERKRLEAETRKRERAAKARQAEIDALERQIAECEAALRETEQAMATPGFYDNRDTAQPMIDRHQELMWQIGDLMHRWERLQSTDLAEA